MLSLILASLAAPIACHRRPQFDPQASYSAARAKFDRGQLLSASDDVDAALRQVRPADQVWTWKFRVLKAQILVWRGLSNQSLDLIKEDLPSSLSSDEIAVRRNIVKGLAHCFLQQFSLAEFELKQAEDQAAAFSPPLLGEVWLARGTLELLRHDFTLSAQYLDRAVQFSRNHDDQVLEANALGSLGVISMRQEQYGKAIDFFESSLAISRVLGNQTQIEKTTGNLGWCYYKLGDLDRALSLFKEAETTASSLGIIKDQQIWLTNIGIVSSNRGDYASADDFYQRALAIARKLENKNLLSICLDNLARLSIETRQYDRAKRYNEEALELKRAGGDRTSELYSIFNNASIQVGTGQMSAARDLFLRVIKDPSSDASLRWEAEAKLANLYVAEGKPDQASRIFRRALKTIDDARGSLNREEYRLSFLTIAADFYSKYIDLLLADGRVEDALSVAEHSRARTLAEGLGVKPAALGANTLRPTALARQQRAVILAYWLKPESSYLWVITSTKVALFHLPADTQIDAAVQAYRNALTGPRDPLETANPYGQQLYHMLVAPAQKLIPENSHVVIIADGSLHALNFETLLAPNPLLHYWIDDVTIRNANSLAMLGSSAATSSTAKANLLLIGNAVSASSEFPPLPEASDEIREVAAHFPDGRETVLAGPKATPAAYLASDPGKFSYIHFVAHGTASRISPLDSAVILSPQGDSYKLYARDIVEKPLQASLVTISACYGSGSRAYSGEGLVGLSWAFLRAGARNVVAALWEANDVSTPQLMDAMYDRIGRGQDPASALHQAKLDMLHSDSIYRRPFYWAPFQLYVGSGRTGK